MDLRILVPLFLGSCLAVDQTVMELRRVNNNLEGIKSLLTGLQEVERGVLASIGVLGRAASGGGRALREGAEEHLQGRQGEVIQLRCRARSDLTWRVERPEGTIVDLESRARKLKVSVNSATTGVYKCYAGGNLVHSFHVTMEREARL